MTMPVPVVAVVVSSVNIELPINQVRLIPLLGITCQASRPVGDTQVQFCQFWPAGSSCSYQALTDVIVEIHQPIFCRLKRSLTL